MSSNRANGTPVAHHIASKRQARPPRRRCVSQFALPGIPASLFLAAHPLIGVATSEIANPVPSIPLVKEDQTMVNKPKVSIISKKSKRKNATADHHRATRIAKPKTDETNKSTLEIVRELPIKKPGKFSASKFKSTLADSVADVKALVLGLRHHKISDAGDYVRLHPNEEEYWSDELCFVQVPIKGQKNRTELHLILESVAKRYLKDKEILRFRLALATKPYDEFFLCYVPSRNTDNSWNESNLDCCLRAKEEWVKVVSLKSEGHDKYHAKPAEDQDSFPEPDWPKQTLDELIEAAFAGKMIETDGQPALLRLRGAKQQFQSVK
jgi:hypothetical protein